MSEEKEKEMNLGNVIEKFEHIKEVMNDDEIENLTGLLAIYVHNLRPPTENWKDLLERLK